MGISFRIFQKDRTALATLEQGRALLDADSRLWYFYKKRSCVPLRLLKEKASIMAKAKKASGRKRNKTNRLKASLKRKRVKQVLRVTRGERRHSA